jgi:hypothetical protein
MRHLLVLAAMPCLFAVSSCDGSGDASPGDVADVDPGDAASQDPGPVTCQVPDPPTAPDRFTLRVPQWHEFPAGTAQVRRRDEDTVCSIAFQSFCALLYLQATPAGASYADPFHTDGAWVLSDGTVTPVVAVYNPGFPHPNPFVTLTVGGTDFVLDHSSFGCYYRSCQPMDCLEVLDPDGRLAFNGCTPDRTIPLTCVRVNDDGTLPPLVDTFHPCPGDPNLGGNPDDCA